MVATFCQYEALKYVSFPVQTLGKCAKMIPVMIWGSAVNGKTYKFKDYSIAILVTLGCAMFAMTGAPLSAAPAYAMPLPPKVQLLQRGQEPVSPTAARVQLLLCALAAPQCLHTCLSAVRVCHCALICRRRGPLHTQRPINSALSRESAARAGQVTSKRSQNLFDSSLFGCLLMMGYLGFDGFTSTWQDKMFKGFSMSIYNQILYVQLCSAGVSLVSLVMFGQARWTPPCCIPLPLTVASLFASTCADLVVLMSCGAGSVLLLDGVCMTPVLVSSSMGTSAGRRSS